MSIYFFSISETESKIRALTGVKSIVFPATESTDIFLKSNLTVTNIDEYNSNIDNILKNTIDDKPLDFGEEYDHFQCLTESVAGGFFHIRHLMCRVAFSATNKKKIDFPIVKNCKCYEQVIKYYIDYSYFHYFAYPIVENYFEIKNQEKFNFSEKEEKIYPERQLKYKKYLKSISDLTHELIGKMIDEDYIHYLKNKVLESVILKGKVNFKYKFYKALIIFSYDVVPILLIGKLWKTLVSVLFKNIKIVIPYLIGRIFPNTITKNTGKLPGIISGDTQIDPVGFSSNKTNLTSSEVSLTEKEKEKNDLLWHILSRVAVIYQHKQFGWTQNRLLKYFQMLREFFCAWQPRNVGSEFIVSGIDFDILEIIFNNKSEKLNYKELSDIALLIFETHKDKELDEADKLSFYSFMNCSYHHI
jgi:hypothetical protein